MFARVTTFHGSPEQYDQMARSIQEQPIPCCSRCQGSGTPTSWQTSKRGRTLGARSGRRPEREHASANQAGAQGIAGASSALEGAQRYAVIGESL
jgi:hypothetical protein